MMIYLLYHCRSQLFRKSVGHCCVDKSGRYCVTGAVSRTKLLCGGLCHTDYSRLCSGVVQDVYKRQVVFTTNTLKKCLNLQGVFLHFAQVHNLSLIQISCQRYTETSRNTFIFRCSMRQCLEHCS